jgi:hypothetical protein
MRMGAMVTALLRAHRLAATLGAKAPDLSDYRTDRFPLAAITASRPGRIGHGSRDHALLRSLGAAGLARRFGHGRLCRADHLLLCRAGRSAPVIGRYLMATLRTFPLAALYLFVILPRVDGWFMLVLTLAPALIRMGYIQADPARSAQALPMFSCFIVAMGFLARFQGDFAAFINTGLAQIGGIVTTLAITRLFRSVEAQWSLRRVLSANWAEMARLSDIRRPYRAGGWNARATDRMGQIAARMALSSSAGPADAADALADLRIGRNVLPIRGALPHVPHARHHLGEVLAMLADLFRQRGLARQELSPRPRFARPSTAPSALLPLRRMPIAMPPLPRWWACAATCFPMPPRPIWRLPHDRGSGPAGHLCPAALVWAVLAVVVVWLIRPLCCLPLARLVWQPALVDIALFIAVWWGCPPLPTFLQRGLRITHDTSNQSPSLDRYAYADFDHSFRHLRAVDALSGRTGHARWQGARRPRAGGARCCGLVTQVAIGDNQSVRKGQVLFVIDPPRYRLALARPRRRWPINMPNWPRPSVRIGATARCPMWSPPKSSRKAAPGRNHARRTGAGGGGA